MSGIQLRLLESVEDFHQAEDLQRAVWPGSELEVAPLHVLLTVARNGGIVLGAFDANRLVGFAWGFLAVDETEPGRPALARLKYCSHMLGVHPDYRDAGIGHRLKLAQRDLVVRQGVRLITWTYDPLESRNASLNIARLRAICRKYIRSHYGMMDDGLNAGLPTDRFQVEWWVTSQRVKQGLAEEPGRRPLTLASFTSAGAQILNPARLEAGPARPSEKAAAPTGNIVLVEIPANFQAMKQLDLPLAQAWRLSTRELFEALFGAGYIVIDFVHQRYDGPPRSYYVLSHSDARAGEA
jgi:predicted GNAT superfamily acetyltransferase